MQRGRIVMPNTNVRVSSVRPSYDLASRHMVIAPHDLEQHVVTNLNMDMSEWQMPGTTEIGLLLVDEELSIFECF